MTIQFFHGFENYFQQTIGNAAAMALFTRYNTSYVVGPVYETICKLKYSG